MHFAAAEHISADAGKEAGVAGDRSIDVYYENRLALCPTCAAKYQYARSCTDTELKERVEAIDGETAGLAVELDVVLAGSTWKIRFVGTHFFDLRVVLDGPEPKDD